MWMDIRGIPRWLRLVAIGCLLLLTITRNITSIARAAPVLPLGTDALAYIAAGRAVAAGADPALVNPNGFMPEIPQEVGAYLYPPLLAILCVPLGMVPLTLALKLWLVLVGTTVLLLIYVLHMLVGWRVAAVAVACFLPTWESVW